MSRRYEEPSYGRPAPREPRREERESRTRIEPRPPRIPDSEYMDDAMDMVPQPRQGQNPRANVGTRLADPQRGTEQVMYKDVDTGQVYQTSRRTPYEDYEELNPRERPVVIDPVNTAPNRSQYREYFLPAEGIDRQVIQREICYFLGNDATMKIGKDKEGRTGYILNAYRPLTSSMIQSLKETTSKHRRDQDSRRSQGQREVPYSGQQVYDDDMDMDMGDDRYPPQMQSSRVHRGEYDIRDQRPPPPSSRHGPPVSSPFSASEPVYKDPPVYNSYPVNPGLTGQHIPQYEQPRAYAGNRTPPSGMRPPVQGYPGAQYPSRTTSASIPGMTTQAYRDPNTERLAYPYPQDPRSRR